MGPGDDLLKTIETIHAAGLEAALWPSALESMMNLTGSRAATLETFARGTLEHRAFHGCNMRPGTRADYLAWGGPPNPRALYAMKLGRGDVFYDGCLFDDDGIDRDPFYVEFLAHHDVRYFIGGVVDCDRDSQTVVTVQRTAREGHAADDEIALTPLLLPHVRLAMEVGRRIESATSQTRAMTGLLDWMVDGAAVLRKDGGVDHANQAFADVVRENDGIGLDRWSSMVLHTTEAQAALALGLRRAARLAAGEVEEAPPDFIVPRPSGASAYVVSIRPLLRNDRERFDPAVAVLFVHDPARRQMDADQALRACLGLTVAETQFARALQAGISPRAYGRERAVSINTVYTHLRRLKEKTGSRALTELISRLNDLSTSVRPV